MGTPPLVATVFLLGALPISLWVAHSDLSRLKIPNRAVLAMAALFVVAGLALVLAGQWALADWSWRLLHLVVVLLIGMGLNFLSMIGAGDAKLLAAVAPFFALSDWGAWLMLMFAVFLVGWSLHRLARATAGPRLAEGWESWSSGKRFPMGVTISGTLLAYLGLCAAA
jgi:prepilin peptidase CpaA